MMTDDQHPSPGTREHFLRVTQLQRWCTIQEYVDLCCMQGYFTPAFYRKATAHMERIHIRRMLRQITDGRGWPILANIVRVDPNGRSERVFMQEELFGPEEYRQVVAYHYRMARHHLFKAHTYREHAKARFGVQLPLFDEADSDEVDGVAETCSALPIRMGSTAIRGAHKSGRGAKLWRLGPQETVMSAPFYDPRVNAQRSGYTARVRHAL
jgi:hypothetical protein